jgi:hypothetical protein
MRQLRRPVGLVAFACAFALLATSAMSAEFVASKTGKTKGKNAEESEQVFKFGAIKTKCLRAIQSGEVIEGKSKTIFDHVKFTKCTTEAKLGGQPIFLKTRFLTPIDFEYHSNGFGEIGGSSASEVKLVAPSSIEMKINAIKCVIEVPAQTVPAKAEKKPEGEYSAVSFSTEEVATTKLKLFPSGFQKKLLIENNLAQIEWSATEGQCTEFTKTESKSGKYTGTLLDELVKGDLSFE